MGNSCSCCFSKKKPQKPYKQKKVAKGSDKSKKIMSDIGSGLDNIATNEITTVYNLPNDEFKTKEEVIRHHGFEVKEEINCGAYAKVHKAYTFKGSSLVACKIVNLIKDSKNRNKRVFDTKNELFVLQKTSHPHIIKMYEHFIINDELYIFMQFALGASLSALVRKSGPFSETQCNEWFAQIVSGVSYLHRKNVAHRDLKLGNILLSGDKHSVYISDFGLSRVAMHTKGGKSNIRLSKTLCGTRPYMAPEILLSQLYNPFDADIWALGVILYVLLNRAYPFNYNDKQKMLRLQRKRKWQFTKHVLQNPSKDLANILNRMLEPDTNKRIKMDQLLNHNWIINQINKINQKLKVTKN